MQPEPLATFVLKCRSAKDPLDLWCRALVFFRSRGVRAVTYQNEDLRFPYATGPGRAQDGYPDAWIGATIGKFPRAVDPLPAVAAQHTQPFWWSEVDRLKVLSDAEERFMEGLKKSGLSDGLALQTYGPKNRNAFVGLGFGRKRPDLSAEEVFELQCGAQVAHVRFCALSPAHMSVTTSLSPRELEVLRWIARGKSNTVIADILGISRHTVDTMMRRMFEKLNVNDRTAAAIRGLGVGLLTYSGSEVV